MFGPAARAVLGRDPVADHVAQRRRLLGPAVGEREPHRFACPPDRSHPELYTHISIDAFPGRSLDAKRALYRGIVEKLEGLGIPRDHVKVLLRELPKENWGIRGGQAGCDVELGFKIEV